MTKPQAKRSRVSLSRCPFTNSQVVLASTSDPSIRVDWKWMSCLSVFVDDVVEEKCCVIKPVSKILFAPEPGTISPALLTAPPPPVNKPSVIQDLNRSWKQPTIAQGFLSWCGCEREKSTRAWSSQWWWVIGCLEQRQRSLASVEWVN